MSAVNVIGLGYIGLPTSVLLAEAGFTVYGIDVDACKVSSINKGISPINEPGLLERLKQQITSTHLSAFTQPKEADIHLIIVPTPFIKETKEADMRFVKQAAKSLSSVLKKGDLIILESTSAVGSTESCVRDVIYTERPDLKDQLFFAFCPERAIPGNTLHELIHNDRVVGGIDANSTEKALSFYSRFIKGSLLKTRATTAELVKLSENAYRDVNIAFANELHLACDTLKIDIWDVIKLANHHPRVNIMMPGAGVGGHCIAIDPWFIHKAAPEVTPLIKQARQVNDAKPEWVLGQIAKAMQETGSNKIGLLGLAYKPDVDDLRESPALYIAEKINTTWKNVSLRVCEPFTSVDHLPQVSLETLLSESDIIVTLTGHTLFKDIPKSTFTNKTVLDICGIYQ